MVLPLIVHSFQSMTKRGPGEAEGVSKWSALDPANPNFHAIALFCLMGLLLTLNFILLFPTLGAVIAQYNQF
jgi:hypothetical protein